LGRLPFTPPSRGVVYGAGMADVVLLHAFPVTSALWSAQAAALRVDGHRVWTPDLRGFGATPLGGDEPSLDRTADDVIALLDRDGVDRAVVGGLSMGGYVAMALLRRAPERVAALVLADTKATADSDEARANRLAVAAAMETGDADLAALAAGLLPALLGETTRLERSDVVATVTGWIASADPAAVAWAQRAMAARPSSLADLEAFDRPALIVWGEEDTLSPRAEQDLMVDALGDVELAVLPGAGHLSAVETPDAVTGVLLDFLGA
jgi:pimeloyl-ACP methyl ester carboxylesterase